MLANRCAVFLAAISYSRVSTIGQVDFF